MVYTTELNSLRDAGTSKIDAAYTVIRQMIMENVFDAGQIVSERLLSSQLGMSRTPIRAALNRLAMEGYVDLKADMCTVVAELGIKDILELYELREALECKAVELFVQRRTESELQELVKCLEAHKQAVADNNDTLARDLDNQMHLLIVRGSKNNRLYTLLSNTISLSQRSIAIGSSYEYRYDSSLPQHQAIIDAIAAGDARQAVKAMRAHMTDVRDFFKRKFIEAY